jgi:ribosome-associated heat shock protein Hsp15
MVNGQTAKASREVRPGDTVVLRQGPVQRTVTVRALSAQRGPAPVAQLLYEETADSIAARASTCRNCAAWPPNPPWP